MRVAMSGALSGESPVDIGVAQGTILGPLIFLVFINDLPEFMADVDVVMYADDTSVAVAARDAEELSVRVQQVIAHFNNWCNRNRIMLNLQKTVYLNFHSRRPLEHSMLGDVGLSHEVNFLGIHIDDRLIFDQHIDQVCNSLNRAFFAILKLKWCLDREAVLSAYYALCY